MNETVETVTVTEKFSPFADTVKSSQESIKTPLKESQSDVVPHTAARQEAAQFEREKMFQYLILLLVRRQPSSSERRCSSTSYCCSSGGSPVRAREDVPVPHTAARQEAAQFEREKMFQNIVIAGFPICPKR